MSLKPFGKKILIKKIESEKEVKKGLLIFPNEKKQEYFYQVLDIGYDVDTNSKDLRVNDIVIVLFSGIGIEHDGSYFYFIEDKDILGRVHE